jgi:hypothetical protein
MIAIFLRLMNEPWLIKAMELLPEDTNYYYTKTYESTVTLLIKFRQYPFSPTHNIYLLRLRILMDDRLERVSPKIKYLYLSL